MGDTTDTKTYRFDELVGPFRQMARTYQLQRLVVGLIGGCIVVGGLWEAILPVKGPNPIPSPWILPLVVAVVGAEFVGISILQLARVRQIPTGLDLGPESITFLMVDGQRVTRRWDDPAFRLEVWDYRAYPVIRRNGTRRRIDFVLSSGGIEGPLSGEAMNELMRVASAHGRQVRGWVERPRRRGAQRIVAFSRR